ncbi:DUF3142 domain-containing protein [Limnobaculum zhutongyuii]
MGRETPLLLVIKRILLVFGLLLSPVVCAAQTGVDASQYQKFWLWAGVRPQPVLHQMSELYLYQGEIVRQQGKARLWSKGIPVSRLKAPKLWLSIRVTTLDIPEPMLDAMLTLREKWVAAGNQQVGIQIDFDAASYQLDKYAEFLSRVRNKLPKDCPLSVTGLLDWAKTGNVNQLNQLPVDELVVQTYQGRKTVTNYDAYLPALLGLTIPFRVGLVQHGEWDKQWQQRLSQSPYYGGEVVFLLNPG